MTDANDTNLVDSIKFQIHFDPHFSLNSQEYQQKFDEIFAATSELPTKEKKNDERKIDSSRRDLQDCT